ncbi:MAG TPA: hypothetical protein DDW50_09295, partial [Firmicutes bacterium]|nr:hypothetical protein [Bacillota bacterium]
VKIDNAKLSFQDYQYGRYMLRNIHGELGLNKYSLLSWNINGNADFGGRMQWTSRGKCRMDKLGGIGEVTVAHVSVGTLAPFIPQHKKYQIHSGFIDGKAQFAWNKKGAWLNRATVLLSNVEFLVPKVRDPFVVKYLSAKFSPVQCEIQKADVIHHQTDIRISGLFNNKTGKIKGLLSAGRIQLGDWAPILPLGKKTSLRGEGELRLAVSGTLNKPRIDGEVFISNGELLWEKEKLLAQIGGRITIRDNNLKIERLEGNWNNSLIGVRGEIDNLFDPQINLEMYGSCMSIQPDLFETLSEHGLKIAGPVNFQGSIIGKPADPKISGEIFAQKIYCQEIPFEGLNLKLEWDNGTKSIKVVEAQSKLWDGLLMAKGDVWVGSKGVRWEISGQATDINLNQVPFASKWDLKGEISSDLIFKGSWEKGKPFRAGSILGVFKGENLAYHDAAIEKTNGIFSWVNDTLRIDSIQAKVDQGMIYGHFSWNPSEIGASLSAENINIHQIMPDNKAYPLEGIFNGSFSFMGPPQKLSGKIEGIFSDVTWAGRKIGSVSGIVDCNQEGFNITEALVSTDVGDCRITGGVSFTGGPRLSLQIVSDNVQLSALSDWVPSIAGFKPTGIAKINCTIDGKWNNPDINGEISLADPTFGPIQMEKGLLRFSGNLAGIDIERFELAKQNTSIVLTGKIDQKQIDLDVHGSGLSLGEFQLSYGGKSFQGTVNLEGKITGNPENPVLDADISGRQLSYGAIHFESGKAQITWQSQKIQIHQAQFNQDQSQVFLQGDISLTKAVPLNLDLNVTAFRLKELLNSVVKLPSGFEADGLLFGTVKLTGVLDNPEIHVDGYMMGGDINSLPVSGEFVLSYKNRQLTIDKFLLNQGSGVFSVDGIYQAGKLTRLNLYLQNFPFQALNPFIDSSYEVNGVVNAYLLLSCSASALSGDYRLGITGLTLNNYQVGDFSVVGHLTNRGLSVLDGTLDRKGTVLTANGYIPWPAGLLQSIHFPVAQEDALQNLKLNVNLKSFPADFANLFLSSFTVLRGTVDGELQLGGSWAKPEVVGAIELNNGAANLEDFPRTIDNFQAAVTFDGHQATIQKARGNYGHGKFNMNGFVTYSGFQPGVLNLGLSGSNIFYNNHYYNGYSNLNLTITGAVNQSVISGDIALYNSRIGIGSSSSSEDDSSGWDPALSLDIRALDNVRFRQLGLADITVDGKVQVAGKLSDPKIEGEATSKQGTITLYSQTFKVDHAKAVFTYDQGCKPYIDLNSSLRNAQAEVFLTAKGQVGDDIAINLTSEPFMSKSDLYAMLNWPVLGDDKNQTKNNNPITGNLGLVTDTVFGDLFNQVRNVLDLDYLYLEPNYQQNDLRLNVGRNISKSLFLSFSRSFMDTQKDEWGLDYQINSRLSLGGDYSELDGSSWRLTYRFGF